MSTEVENEEAGTRRSAEQAAFLNILRTADLLDGEVADLLKPYELSSTQYNVLRILRAAGASGLPCGQIAQRMLTRDPDITRLLDRLENRGWITRARSPQDRRVVVARLAPAGRKVVGALDQPILELHQRQL